MDGNEFIKEAKRIVEFYYNSTVATGDDDATISQNDVFVISVSKTLQNNKGWFATNVPNDDREYEINYNGDKKEAYLDIYQKVDNAVFKYNSVLNREGKQNA